MSSPSATRPALARQHYLLILLGITGLALLLRLVVCLELLPHASVQSPLASTDMATYRRLAMDIHQGLWPDHFDYQPLYYSVFLPLIYLLKPGSAGAVAMAQALLGAAAVLLTGLCAARLYGRRAGIAAAALLALSRFHIFYTPFLLLEVLLSFWMILLLWLALLAWRHNRARDWLALALLCAAATLTRGNALLMFPAILLLLLWRNRQKTRRAALLCLLSITLFYLPQLPYGLRNLHYAGRWCGASTAGGKVLALGNSPEAPPGGLEYPLTYHRWCADAENPDPAQRVSVPAHIIRWFLAEPHLVCELKIRSFLLFWDRQEVPNNVSIDREGRQSRLLQLPILLPFALISALTLLGLAVLWRRRSPQRLFLFYLIGTYCFSTVLFYILARFRIGGLPLFCVVAGGAIDYLLGLRRRLRRFTGDAKRQHALAFALQAALALFLAGGAFGFWQTTIEPALMRRFRPQGLHVEFPDTTLVYDHGPLSVGGLTPMSVPDGGLRLEKTLVLPESLRALPPSASAVWRIVFVGTPDARWSAALTHAGTRHLIGPAALRQDRFLTWLEVPLPVLDINDAGHAKFILDIIPTQGSVAIGVDRLRDYGRSHFFETDGKSLDLPPAEAACEVQVYRQ